MSVSWSNKPALPQVTSRAILAGLIIGSVVLFSNFQFGLQTGWVSMMSLPSSLLGFATFKTLSNHLNYPFTDVENVFIQSLAVAVGTGPLAFGLVGVIPAIEKFLTLEESNHISFNSISTLNLIIWSIGLGFFGVFFAVLLRSQIIVREKLRFPSGSATAILISVLHSTIIHEEEDTTNNNKSGDEEDEEETVDGRLLNPDINQDHSLEFSHEEERPGGQGSDIYYKNITVLLYSFGISSLYTVITYFIPVIRNLPIFGSYLASNYLWTFQPSPAYIGQGIIMGFPTVTSMLLGAVIGWAILAPMSQSLGWATGPIDDWKTGGQGWILWVSLAVMVSDAVVSFVVITASSMYKLFKSTKKGDYEPVNDNGSGPVVKFDDNDDNDNDDVDLQYLVPFKFAVAGLVASLIACIITTRIVFGPIVPIYATISAVILALFLSVLAVRALGETDLNPVSGIGKISQVLFAFIIPRDHPASVLINLIAGGITEAGAQQAGDLMQDLKSGHMIGASPRAQFYAQLIGSAWSVLLSSWVYRLYDSVYQIPGDLFRIPTAVIWIDCSRLVTGEGLPPHVGGFTVAFGIIFGLFAIAKILLRTSHPRLVQFIPSGVAVGIGIYNTPSFTLARFVGGCVAAYWAKKYPNNHDASTLIIILSSGLVLGEGVTSIVSLIMTSFGVPHL